MSASVLGRSRRFASGMIACLLAMASTSCNSGAGPSGPGPGDGCEHIDYATGMELVTHGVELYRQQATTSAGSIQVTAGGSMSDIEVRFLRASGDAIVIPNDCAINELRFEVGDPNVVGITQDPARRWFFGVDGRNAGSTTIRILLWHSAGHAHFRSELIPVNVVAP